MLAAKVAFDLGGVLRNANDQPPTKKTSANEMQQHGLMDLNTLAVGSSLIGRPFTIKGLTENEPPIEIYIEKGEDGRLIVSVNEKNFCVEDPVFMYQTIKAAIDDLVVGEQGAVHLSSEKNGDATSSVSEMQRILYRLHAHQRSGEGEGTKIEKVEERIAANFIPNNEVMNGFKQMAGSTMLDADGQERYLVSLARLADSEKKQSVPLALAP